MRPLALAVLATLASIASPPGRAAAQDAPLPPPPPPPSYEPAAPVAGASPAPFVPGLKPGPRRAPGTIGEGPVAPAGSQAAPLHPDETVSHWRFSLATGLAERFGGYQLESAKQNNGVLLYFAGQADGLWTEGYGQAARFRARLFTGGESDIYLVSDGDVEAAYMIGRREFRFVIARAELARYTALGLQALATASTLPCFEGSLALGTDSMRLYYYVSPVAASWVRYYGGAHIDGTSAWPSESGAVNASTSGRLRYTVLLPPSMLLSLQGDLLKLWQKADMLVAAEAALGYQVLDQSAVFNATVRWQSYTRRGTFQDTSATESEVLLLASASLVF